MIDGLVKLDLTTGAAAARFTLPQGRHVVSEPTFVAREGGSGGEDDGYLLLVTSAVTAAAGGTGAAKRRRVSNGSTLLVFDARTIGEGPVAELPLPADLPYGLHSCFVPWGDLTDE